MYFCVSWDEKIVLLLKPLCLLRHQSQRLQYLLRKGPDFDAEEVELTVVVAELAVFVVGLAERLCEEKVEKEDKDVLVPRKMIEMKQRR